MQAIAQPRSSEVSAGAPQAQGASTMCRCGSSATSGGGNACKWPNPLRLLPPQASSQHALV